MKRKHVLGIKKALFILVALFAIVGAVFYNIKITDTTAKFVVDVNQFYVNLFTNIQDNIVIYALLLGVILVVYYFNVYKPKKY